MKSAKKLLLTLLFTTISILTFAQGGATVSGIIIDKTTQEPLPGATIIVDSTTMGSISNEKGEFTITGIPKNVQVKFNVSFFGYYPAYFLYTAKNDVNTLAESFAIEENSLSIDEVVIKGAAPTAIQLGDTTQYNAGAYKTNPDATAEDLLAKMPGFQISDGKVESAGESITRIYVDGKPFFNEDPTAALNSLPADIVESIQVMDEISDRSKFTGGDDGDVQKAINIVTKAKSDNVHLGDFSAGYGTNGRYSTRANYTMFDDVHRITAVFGANNINQAPASGGSSRFYARHWQTGIQRAIGGRVNYNGVFKKDSIRITKVNANYLYENNDNDLITEQNQLSTVNDYTFRDQYGNNTLTEKHSFNALIESNLNERNRITFRPRLTITTNDSDIRSRTARVENGDTTKFNQRFTQKEQMNYNTGGTLTWMHRINDNHSIVTSIFGSFSENNIDQDMAGSNLTYSGTIADTTLVGQKTPIYSSNNRVKGSFDYALRLNDLNRMTFEYDGSYNWSASDKKAYKFSGEDSTFTNFGSLSPEALWSFTEGHLTDLDENLSNIFDRDYLTNELGVGYSHGRYDTFRFSAKVGYQNSAIQNKTMLPRDTTFNYNFNTVVANMYMSIPFSKSKKLILYYRARPQLPSIDQLQDVINDTNPLKVTKGNANLKQSYNNMFSTRYMSNNIDKSTSFKAYLWLNNNINNISTSIRVLEQDEVINGVTIEKGAQLTSPVNMGTKWDVYSGADYSFPVKALSSKMNTAVKYGFSNSPSVYNNQINYTKNNWADIYFSLVSNITENIDFTIANSTRYSHTRARTSTTYYLKESATVKFNLLFLKNFVFNTLYSYSYNLFSTDENDAPQTHRLNAGIGYKFFHRNAEVRVSGYDLLNQCVSYNQSVSDQYITNLEKNTMQRYIMVSFSYKFNSLVDGARRRTKKLTEVMEQHGFIAE